MRLNIKKHVMIHFLELLKKGHILVGVLITILPPLLIAYFSIYKNMPFTIKHVSNFYCMFGMLAAVLHPLYFVNRDYSTKVASLINNSRKNRLHYAMSNYILSVLIALLYASIGIILLVIVKNFGVEGTLTFKFIIGFLFNIILLVTSYFALGYLMVLYRVHIGIIYATLTALLLFIHNIFSNILETIQNEHTKQFIENFPIYYYPALVGSKPFSFSQYTIGMIILCLITSWIFTKNLRNRY
ncbi:ABC transporter permease [Staphylococcus felis]|uniref:ABC transporter permease n=1 Tax=Staphylococcus felis TaxID=46127 RepID=UPI000E22B0C3|nr:ABC transporter permease [Staphylococcus felis]REH96246.1 ABC transporter permease [Staphylococcus felis]REI04699.1 ABC transporter permease [Staphylococcus felis]REI24430.1 ABC transporter permease [Staphylococcus felis]REI34979.1 ABC transporter permease [Staphylococcus felis]